MSGTVSVPIRFVSAATGQPIAPSQAASYPGYIPLIDVLLIPSNGSLETAVSMCAMVDTGSTHCVLDEEAAKKHALLQVAEETISTGHMSAATRIVEGLFRFAGTGLSYQADFALLPLRALNKPYDMIIGLSAMRHGALLMDYLQDVYRLEFPAPRVIAPT